MSSQDDDDPWRRSGLEQFQVVRCVVTGHRGRFGVEVAVTAAERTIPGFIDFVLLTDDDRHPGPADFPPVGTSLDAVTIDFMPNGELRLSAQPSAVEDRGQNG
ncbi:hypothetical protein ACIHCQ_20035 [Streptomyces sp. NPDC052236]|uniref:hypothetical protein n=1 Tax=Streptomyces sp. NPDC052236 TaxID=3365686 RepID=UPI0037D84D9F